MNREIKFKAKHLKSGEWVYGYFVHYYVLDEVNGDYSMKGVFTSVPTIFNNSPEQRAQENHWRMVDEDTVCQFTGKYHNEIELYEHDLLVCGEVLCEIVYNDKIAGFSLLELDTQQIGSRPLGEMLELFDVNYKGSVFDYFK